MKKMNRALSLLLILALLLGSLLLGGCGKEPDLPAAPPEVETPTAEPEAAPAEPEPVDAEPEPVNEEPESVDAEPETENIYLEDYRQFWEILETDYPYLPYLETRYDLNEIRESFEAVAAQTDNLNDFYKLLNKVCKRLGNFAHLYVLSPDFYQLYYAYVSDPELSEEDPSVAPFREILTDPTLASIYQPPSADYVEEKSGQYPEVKVSYYEDCDALVLEIYTFAYEVVERDRTVLTDALKQYPNTKHIIFDIRKNGGGDTTYFIENLILPLEGNLDGFIGQYKDYLYYRDTPRISPFFSAYDPVPVSELTDVPDWVAELKLDRCVIGDPFASCAGEAASESPDSIPGSGAKRWVIVGGNTYSSAEAFTVFCKRSGWATVVGHTTGGDGVGVTPVLAKLDRTGILIRFSAHVGENPSTGLPSAYSGTVPDYKGTLETCLDLIRGEA